MPFVRAGLSWFVVAGLHGPVMLVGKSCVANETDQILYKKNGKFERGDDFFLSFPVRQFVAGKRDHNFRRGSPIKKCGTYGWT